MKKYTITFEENNVSRETVIYAECLESALSVLFANYDHPFVTDFRSTVEEECEQIPF